MPVGNLINVLFLAWCTYYVVAPSHWSRALHSFGTYFEVINEVPFLALFWLISATDLALSEGNLAHPVGKIAFGLSLLVVGGISGYHLLGLAISCDRQSRLGKRSRGRLATSKSKRLV